MSSGYSANQYENAFKSQRLQNWCATKHFKERPTAKVGQTRIIVNDRGHLLPGVKQKDSAWPDFKGTWDLPTRIPAQRICPTARSVEGLDRLRSWGFDSQHPGKSQPHRGSKNTSGEEKNSPQQIKEAVQLDTFVRTFSPPAVQSTSQEISITGNENQVTENQDLTVKPESDAAEAADKGNFEICQITNEQIKG